MRKMEDATHERQKGNGRNQNAGPRRVIMNLIQAQLAGLTTGAAFLSQWAEIATSYNEQVGKILIELARNPESYAKATADTMDQYRNYLGQMTTLPRISAMRFYSELERIRNATADVPPQN
jgi:predicted nucleotidyltransferase